MNLPVMTTVFVNQLRQFHVVAAILRDLQKSPVLEPADRLQTFRRFFHAERRRRNRIEREPMVQFILQIHHQVERRQLSEVERRVAVQHFVIEPQIVEPDDQIRPLQIRDEFAHGFFMINFVFAARRIEGDADAHAHFGNVVPPADFIGGFLGFQIEINDALGHGCTYL